ncbi:MAG TPA: alpha/beta hydrolase-fold protein [Bacilli bacterium]|nr:alpha/beta hydrolase-fold protein [Bacilli bacterium]
MNKLHTVTRGKLIKHELTMHSYSDLRKRTIRVWLPENYDANNKTKKFPVLYMHDAQNLFDFYTSFVGEWEVDETISRLIDEGYGGAIVVGIDNSPDRLNELSPSWARSKVGKILENPSGEKYATFIVNEVIPFINQNYHTLPERENTLIGGSSMGGVMSLFMALNYADVFGGGLLFSSALQLYEEKGLDDFLKSAIKQAKTLPNLYIYSGNAGGDAAIGMYVDILAHKLVEFGYSKSQLTTLLDEEADHNEKAWAVHFPRAFQTLVNINVKK